MAWEHELDEKQHFVAMKFFEHCSALEKLTIVQTGCVTPWHPTRGSEGVLETVHSARDDYETWQTYDDEGFPTPFTFPRQANICDESFDPPSYGDESREALDYRVIGLPPYSLDTSNKYQVKERRRYRAIMQEAYDLDLWEGATRMYL